MSARVSSSPPSVPERLLRYIDVRWTVEGGNVFTMCYGELAGCIGASRRAVIKAARSLMAAGLVKRHAATNARGGSAASGWEAVYPPDRDARVRLLRGRAS